MATGNNTQVSGEARIEISRDLGTLEYAGPSGTVVPEDIYWQQESATTFTPQGGASWIIIPPAKGMLLNDKPLIEWRCRIHGLSAELLYDATTATANNCVFRVAPRQCNPISNSMMTFALVINGQVLDSEPIKYAHIMDRVHSTSTESATVFSKSGGELDSGIGLRFVLPVDMGANNLNYISRVYDKYAQNGAGAPTAPRTKLPCIDGVVEMLAGCDPIQNPGLVTQDIGNSSYINYGLAARKKRFDLYRQHFGNLTTGVVQAVGFGNPGMTNAGMVVGANWEAGFAAGNVMDKGHFEKSFWEVPPCGPFSQYMSRDRQETIPHIEQMTMQARFRPDLFTKLILQCACVYRGRQGRVGSAVMGDLPVHTAVELGSTSFAAHGGVEANHFAWITQMENLKIYLSEAPIFHMKWLQPPQRMTIKPVARIPITRYVNFETPKSISITAGQQDQLGNYTAIASHATNSAFKMIPGAGSLDEFMKAGLGHDITFINNNIRLESMPDRFYVVVQRNQNEKQLYHPTEHNLAIKTMKINIDGKSGRFLQANAYELYTISMKYYAEPVSFEFWFWSSCIVVFTAADLGVHVGAGWNRPISLHIEATCYYNKHLPLNTNFCIANQFGRAMLVADANAAPTVKDLSPSIDSPTPIIGNFDVIANPSLDISAGYILQVTCEFSRYVLTLGADGRSDLRMITI